MTFDQIMTKISSELTGDRNHDIPYLKKQMESYREHEFSLEIIRACGRMLWPLLSEEEKQEIAQITQSQTAGVESTLEEIRFKIFEQDFDGAMALILPLIERIESENKYQDDQVNEYHTFGEPIEEVIYDFMFKPKKTVRLVNEMPLDLIYLYYGSLLFEKGNYSDASKALTTALRWNPVNPDIHFEFIELFKVNDNLEEFANLTRDLYKLVYTPAQVARCHRNMGFYFIEQEEWEVATLCFQLSMMLDPETQQRAISEIYYIQQMVDINYPNPIPIERAQELFEKYNIPEIFDDTIPSLAGMIGQKAFEKNHLENAAYFLRISNAFYDDPQLQDILNTIDNHDIN